MGLLTILILAGLSIIVSVIMGKIFLKMLEDASESTKRNKKWAWALAGLGLAIPEKEAEKEEVK